MDSCLREGEKFCKKSVLAAFIVVLVVCPEFHMCATVDVDAKLSKYREKVVSMFQHAYDGYVKHAYPYDELRPLTCDGHDTWGSFSLTLIDALDTLAVMGNASEFQRVAKLIIDRADFNRNVNVSVFETNIRVVGGLLSAHLFTKKMGMTVEPGWPCTGPLLNLAENVARRLLPAFETATKMPYGTVNLQYGVPNGETPVTCTACVGTYIIEFSALSRLTGDPVFEDTANAALEGLWKARSSLDLVGNHINVQTGHWTALDSGIGGGIDSYFEYLVKAAVMYKRTDLLEMFKAYEAAVEKHTKRDDWYLVAHMSKGTVSGPLFQSLEAFWPGMQSLIGDVEKGMRTIHNYHQIWQQFGFTPEMYNIAKSETHAQREGYPLRPELIESAMYLYRATGDPFLLEIGYDITDSIAAITATDCGFATVKNVNSHKLENRMESFFLSETAKYLYLLFTPDNFIHNTGTNGVVIKTPGGECVIDSGGYVFNTEAHPLDIAAIHCCSADKKHDDLVLGDLHDNLDLLTLFGIVDPDNDKFSGIKLKDALKYDMVNSDDSDEDIDDVLEEEDANSAENGMLFKPMTSETESEAGSLKVIVGKSEDSSLKSDFTDKIADIASKSKLETQNDNISQQQTEIPKNNTVIDTMIKSLQDSLTGMLKNKQQTDETNSDVKIEDIVDKLLTVKPNIGTSGFSIKAKSRTDRFDKVTQLKPKLLSCPALPYYMKFSAMGEMFHRRE